jgi:hypothetical protein
MHLLPIGHDVSWLLLKKIAGLPAIRWVGKLRI